MMLSAMAELGAHSPEVLRTRSFRTDISPWEETGRVVLNSPRRNRANLGPLVQFPTLENGGDVFCDLLLESRFPILGQKRSGDRIAG